MRMPRDYFEALRAVIREHDTLERRACYLAGNFPRSDRVKDLDARYRWDQFWNAERQLTLAGWRLPGDLKDAHIDTALRHIVAPLTGEN